MTSCRKFCVSDGDCDASRGELCAGLVPDPTMMFWMWGLCVPTCTPFGADCTTIAGAGFNCSYVLGDTDGQNAFFTCKQPGALALGAACGGTGNFPDDGVCGADTICYAPTTSAPPVCTLLCDGTSATPCPTGTTCVGAMPGSGGMPGTVGLCQ